MHRQRLACSRQWPVCSLCQPAYILHCLVRSNLRLFCSNLRLFCSSPRSSSYSPCRLLRQPFYNPCLRPCTGCMHRQRLACNRQQPVCSLLHAFCNPRPCSDNCCRLVCPLLHRDGCGAGRRDRRVGPACTGHCGEAVSWRWQVARSYSPLRPPWRWVRGSLCRAG